MEPGRNRGSSAAWDDVSVNDCIRWNGDRSSVFELQLLIIREIAGRIEAVLSWSPDRALLQAAAGTELRLASHLFDSADGRLLVWDGPRSTPGLGPNLNLTVLPLPVPPQPGNYRFQIEPVAELRFWASDLGYKPMQLDAERKPNGSVVVLCGPTSHQFVLNRAGMGAFIIDAPLYGVGDSERCVEIPWVLSRFRGERRVLDVGYANAEPRYVEARDALGISSLIGLDMASASQPGLSGVAGDVLAPPFRPGVFDLICAISVIEHIGRDNSVYFDRAQAIREFADLEASACLASLLRPGGRLLITLPFGRPEDHGWFIQYDLKRITALVEMTSCQLTAAEYYAYGTYGWSGPLNPAALCEIPYCKGRGAGAVACLELTNTDAGL